MRCFELIDSDKQYTPQRMNIINTIAEVFKISQQEFNSIMHFVREEQRESFTDASMIVISTGSLTGTDQTKGPFIVFLQVAERQPLFHEVLLYGHLLSQRPAHCVRKVYTFAPGSTVQSPPAPTIYYSDVISRFASGKDIHPITFVAEHLSYSFTDGTPAITDVSFAASEGKLIGIMGASGSGKTTLLNLLTGLAQSGIRRCKDQRHLPLQGRRQA
ncbi:MAG: ATP-binding cassette domain-containing protein [Marinilabiliales bacterium]|nr:ATP-binding cassette domain-containing protein [Marinilabiliales bacterium]